MRTITNAISALCLILFAGLALPEAAETPDKSLGHNVSVSIPIYAQYDTLGEGIYAATIRAEWNPNHFWFEDFVHGAQWSDLGFTIVENRRDTAVGLYVAAYAGTQPLEGDSLIATLLLRTKEVSAEGFLVVRSMFNEIPTEFTESVTYEIDAALPVELIWFLASVEGDTVAVSWRTASELNAASFHLDAVPMYWNQDGLWKPGPAVRLASVPAQGTDPDGHFYEVRYGDLMPGFYQFVLTQIDFDGTFRIYRTELYDVGIGKPAMAIYPNPANPSIVFSLSASSISPTEIDVYDLLGRHRKKVFSGDFTGTKTIRVPLDDLTSGIYLAVMRRNDTVISRKFTVVR